MSILSTPSTLLLPTKTPSANLHCPPKPPSNFSLLKSPFFPSFSRRRRSPSRTFSNRPRIPGFPSFSDGLGKVGEELGRAADIANDVVSGDPGKAIGDVKDEAGRVKDGVGEVVSGIFGHRKDKDEVGQVSGDVSGEVEGEAGVVGGFSGDNSAGEPDEAGGGGKGGVGRVGGVVSGVFAGAGGIVSGVVSGSPDKVISEVKKETTQVAGVVSDVVAGAPEKVIGEIKQTTQVTGITTGDKGTSEKKGQSGGIISGVVAGAGGVVSGIVAGAPDKVIGEIKKETTQVTSIASDAIAGAPGKVVSEIKKDTTQVTQIASDVAGAGGIVSGVVSNAVSGTVGTVSDAVAGAPAKIVTEVKKETTQVTQIASDVAGATGKAAELAGAVVANAPDMVVNEIKGDVGRATQIATDVVTGRPDKVIGDIAGEVGRVGGIVSGVISGDGALRKKLDSMELKKSLVDTVKGTNLGFRASPEVRAEVAELVAKLEMVNPNPDPIENTGLLDGNWVLVYTAYSELLPLLALGSTPVLKVDKITQDIDTRNQTVANSVTLSSGILSFTFTASASFQVQTSSRIQVQFKEAIFKPPEIKPRLDVPDNVEVLGQKIPLSPVQTVLNPVQQVLSPVQDAASSISQSLLGLPSLKLPIPGERTASWLLVSYLDENLRISRGDGGLFVLVKEGSSLFL